MRPEVEKTEAGNGAISREREEFQEHASHLNRSHGLWLGIAVDWETIPLEDELLVQELVARLKKDADECMLDQFLNAILITADLHRTKERFESDSWSRLGAETGERKHPTSRKKPNPLFPWIRYAVIGTGEEIQHDALLHEMGLPRNPVLRDTVIVALEYLPRGSEVDIKILVNAVAEMVVLESNLGMFMRQNFPEAGGNSQFLGQVIDIMGKTELESSFDRETITAWLKIFFEVVTGRRFVEVYPIGNETLCEALGVILERFRAGDSRAATLLRNGVGGLLTVQMLIWAVTDLADADDEARERERGGIVRQLAEFFGVNPVALFLVLRAFSFRMAQRRPIAESFDARVVAHLISPLLALPDLSTIVKESLATAPILVD